MPTDPLASAQNDLFERIRTRVQIQDNGIDVQQMRPRSEGEATAIVESINHTLAGTANSVGGPRAGLAVLVPLPAFEVKNPNIPGLFGEMVFTVIVLENILVNAGATGSGVTCEQAAVEVMLAGHLALIADGRVLTCDGMVPMKVDGEEFSADIAYEITFRAAAGFTQETSCAQPLITTSGGNVTITCSTTGVELRMTMNGSYPAPDNPDAVTVPAATPIDATDLAGLPLRVVAYRAELNPSLPAYLRL